MSKHLIKTTEMYRVDNEAEANALIEEAQGSKQYNLIKHSCEAKQKKSKDFIDEWYRVTLVKVFTDEKEPIVQADVTYTTEVRGNGAF